MEQPRKLIRNFGCQKYVKKAHGNDKKNLP